MTKIWIKQLNIISLRYIVFFYLISILTKLIKYGSILIFGRKIASYLLKRKLKPDIGMEDLKFVL